MNMSLSDTKTIAEIIESFVTVAALVIGGVWTYFLFVRNRLGLPQVQIAITPQEVLLPDGKRLIHAALSVKNLGNVILKSDYAELRLRSVVPLPEKINEAVKKGYDIVSEGQNRVEWPLIASREWTWAKGEFEVEPQEEEILHCDYIIDSSVAVVEFYCFLQNRAKKKIGWTFTLMHETDQQESNNDGREDQSKQD